MDSPAHLVQAMQSEAERLLQYLDAFPPEAWDRPSACDRWLVRDVVAHLAGGGAAYAEWLTRSLHGDASPPEGRPPAGSVNATSSAEQVAQRALASRASLGDQVLAAFKDTNNHLTDLVGRLTPADWEKPCYHPSRVMPVRTLVGFRVLELAVHSWDIRSQLEPSAHLVRESLPVIVAFFSENLLWFFHAGAKLEPPVRYRFALVGGVSGAYDIIVEGDTAHMGAAGETVAHVTFRGEAEIFILLMCGRLRLETAMAEGHLVVEGDHGLAAAFRTWFRGA